MDADTYLAHLRDDAARLGAAARRAGLTAPVPTCPEWDVAALVHHVGAVYHHKVACMRLQRRPAEDEWSHGPAAGEDVWAWFDGALAELVGELTARGPDAPSYTWYPPDRTVGFWFRRMAQETVVHRLDAELADGAASPVDDALALDGVDEMLGAFLTGPWWREEPVPAATGRTVAVRSGSELWRVTLEPEEVRTDRADGPAAGTVEGAPYDVLMWAWGRPPAGGVTVTGDASAVVELDERLAVLRD